jgi:four helix bundle protein
MTFQRFEDLPVWNSAIELATRLYAFTRDRYFAQPGDLRDQLRRASLSVSNNIAEGFERGSTSELIAFLYIARGSAGEVRSMLHFILRQPDAFHLHPEAANIIAAAESCSRQIRAWANNLQNSDFKGQRHWNDQARSKHSQQKRVSSLERKIAQTLHQHHPDIFPPTSTDP